MDRRDEYESASSRYTFASALADVEKDFAAGIRRLLSFPGVKMPRVPGFSPESLRMDEYTVWKEWGPGGKKAVENYVNDYNEQMAWMIVRAKEDKVR
jgi:hypothetical protein